MVTNNLPVQVVAGGSNPDIPNQMDSLEYAGQITGNPQAFFTQDNPTTPNQNESMTLSDHQSTATAAQIDGSDPKFANNPNQFDTSVQVVDGVTPQNTNTYQAQTTYNDVANNGQMTGAQGQVSDGATIEAPQIDMQGVSTGTNADGTINETGVALSQYASQDMSNIINTSTVSGKLLAQSLGEGNYVDSKSTMQGQLEILSKEFVDSAGNPKIPTWAAGTARNASKIMAFKGVTGTAALGAMSQALMEASLPIAQADSQFFQTLTVQNLSNKQQQVINTANVMSKMELTNLDNRMAAAVQNSNNFMAMDLKNLDNDQQAAVINTQARVQSILEDAKSINTQRMFEADSQNEMDKFYDELGANIDQFNATQFADKEKFNSNLASSRDNFYKEMQYNIDVSNANWRQNITLQEDEQQFQSAKQDVQNMVGVSQESLNQIWDRSDALLDYVWKSSESQLGRDNALAVSQLQIDAETVAANAKTKAATSAALGKLAFGVLDKSMDVGFTKVLGNVFGGLF
jgi:hypothetical protein